MSTQSKSVLVPFLIIAGLLFVVALAWKLLGNSETETITEPSEVEITTPVKTEKTTKTPTVQNKQPTVIDYDQPESFLDPTEADREVLRNEARSNMKFSMRYKTIDKALTGLKGFRESGNDKMAEDLIVYIYTTFPNDTIPAELLD